MSKIAQYEAQARANLAAMRERDNTELGSRAVAQRGLILHTVAGSEVVGVNLPGTGDRDEMGIYIEPPEYTIGITPTRGSYMYRTQPQGARSGPGDLDLTVYGLRKYLGLAIKGNPSVLLPLFAPEEFILERTIHGDELRELGPAFLSWQTVERFLGYMHAQHERMLGRGKQNRVPNRPELIEAYGWDVKYGAHALRLAYQGLEVASYGTLTLPMEEYYRERVLEVRRGERSRESVSNEIASYESAIRALLRNRGSQLPETADTKRIEQWAIAATLQHWKKEN